MANVEFQISIDGDNYNPRTNTTCVRDATGETQEVKNNNFKSKIQSLENTTTTLSNNKLDKTVFDNEKTNIYNMFNVASINLLNSIRDEDCILITTNNGKTILIDTGEGFSQSAILQRLDSLGVVRLDYLVITHFHSDHSGNSAKIIEKYRPKNVYYKEVFWDMLPSVEIEWGTKTLFDNFITACTLNNITPIKVTSDIIINLSKKENIKILNTTFVNYSDYNSASLMVLYNNGKTNCLFPSDVTTEVLEYYKSQIPQLSLYKAAHHGGYEKNVSESFVNSTRPKITHINGYGLPYSQQTMNLVKWACNGDVYIDGEYNRGTFGYLVNETGVFPSSNLKKVTFSEHMFDYKNNWYLCDSSGELVQDGIINNKGNLCYVKNFIYVVTPMWITYNTYDYCIGQDGFIMCNQWKQSEDISTPNKWYYLGHNGRMLKSTTRLIDGKMYTFDGNGVASPQPI